MTNYINSLKDLAEKLASCNFLDKKKVESYLANLNLDVKQLSENCIWNEKKYTRNVVYRDNKFEMLLLCWKIGHKSPIHDHNGSSCWMKILQGTAEERTYSYIKENQNFKNIKLINQSTLSATNYVYIDDEVGIHQVENTGKTNLITLHIYAKPIGTCLRYEFDRDLTSKAEFHNDYKFNLDK